MRQVEPSTDRARPVAHQVVDCVVLALTVLLALVPLLPVYGTASALPAVVGGTVAGALVAVVAAVRVWPVMTTVATLLVLYVLLGGALAVPTTTVAGVVPTLDTLTGLADGVVTSWKQILTLEPPLGRAGNVLVVPFVLGLGGAATAGVVAAGRRHPVRLLTAAAIPVVVLVLSILLGTVERLLVTVVGTALAAVLLTWGSWRTGHLRPRRHTSLALLAVVSLVGGVLLAPVVGGDEPRFVLRSTIVPPFDPREHPSPLSGYRTYMKDAKETDLLTVRGLPEGAVVRLATMDAFDGVVWNVLGDGQPDGSGAFRRVGDAIPTSVQGETVEVEVDVHALDGVWLPTVGHTTAVDFTGPGAERARNGFRYNDATGTGVLTDGVGPEQSYTLEAVLPPVPTDEEIGDADPGQVVVPQLVGVPDVVTSRSTEVAARATTAALAARAIESYLHDTGFFSHGIEAAGDYPSLSGHGASRITELLGGDIMVGDAEQYASAMALLVNQQGLPARVVMGFVPDEEQAGDPEVTFTGENVQAWVEVNYQGVGWVPYFPTPPTSQTPQENEAPVEQEPQPQVVQPPPPPPDPTIPPDADDEEPNVDSNQDDEDTGIDLRRIATITAAVGIPLLLLVLPPLLVVLAKRRRRRRRQRATDPAARISGGWDEVVDTARDHGTPPVPAATRRETARTLTLAHPGVPGPELAERADAAVFAAAPPEQAQVDEYWLTVDRSVRAIRGDLPRWARLRGTLSLASLRARRDSDADREPRVVRMLGAVRRR
ncbi:transglutaminase domain-containing protein [Sanguibacter sp. YZGR15]|uniref:Transglutaminase domain-containing protein n=1 Tax=Sanguibacter suaedae TaxID=2795737 RepID=A0A934MAN0_9MICO|nr:transglutaminase domain-containing protein [Sanguibacter suaedae]